MPELPEVTALTKFIADHAAGQTIDRVMVTALGLLATVNPSPNALIGGTLTGTDRHGKFLDFVVRTPPSDTAGAGQVHLIVHLARAGWLRWSDKMSAVIPKMGGPIALRMWFGNGTGFDLTEAGTKKSMTAWLVHDPSEVPGIARLGPDALEVTIEEFAEILAGATGHLKNVLTDQTRLAGVGNAYSDEILHTAKLSPFAIPKKLTEAAVLALYDAMRSELVDAVERSVGQQAARLKGEKRSGLRVHGMFGLPCPVCGDTVAQVEFANKSFQYCPTCQTGGKKLADRGMSRLLR